jgi:hypothetical protein
MQERVNLVRGKYFIDSRPGRGTRIVVVVRLPAKVEPSNESGIAEQAISETGTA